MLRKLASSNFASSATFRLAPAEVLYLLALSSLCKSVLRRTRLLTGNTLKNKKNNNKRSTVLLFVFCLLRQSVSRKQISEEVRIQKAVVLNKLFKPHKDGKLRVFFSPHFEASFFLFLFFLLPESLGMFICLLCTATFFFSFGRRAGPAAPFKGLEFAASE